MQANEWDEQQFLCSLMWVVLMSSLLLSCNLLLPTSMMVPNITAAEPPASSLKKDRDDIIPRAPPH
jgi:hypothetical protein